MTKFNFSIFTMSLTLKFWKRNMRHLCLLNHQESESNTYNIPKNTTFNQFRPQNDFNWHIESYYSNLIRKEASKFWIFFLEKFGHSVLLWAVWPYLFRHSQTYFDYLWHVFELPDMFLMSRIPRIIFSYHINFSSV